MSDPRPSKRKLGKEIIIRARQQQSQIDGVRIFSKITKITDINEDALDYSNFLDLKNMKIVTEPPVTMHLTNVDLDNIVDGQANLVDLCGLQNIPCHTTVKFSDKFLVTSQ